MKGLKAACAVGLAIAGTTASAQSEYLKHVMRGEVSKADVELVLAQHDENVAWSDPYASVRTVYCKGGAACSQGAIRLPNVGGEGHTFLHHIVNNYDDKLAKWTVFSQAEAPTEGYMGHGRGGGHMLSGAKFEHYLEPGSDAKFLITSKVHLPTLNHALRSTFKTADGPPIARASSHPSTCPAGDSIDEWGPYTEMPWLRKFISEKCAVEESAMGQAMLAFWDDYVQLPRPRSDIVHYAQGARFAASRERIHQRPKAFYERLLQMVVNDADPCLNYLYEYVWYYVIGTPQGSPCNITLEEAAGEWKAARRLQSAVSGGVSGPAGTSTANNAHKSRCAAGSAFFSAAAVFMSTLL